MQLRIELFSCMCGIIYNVLHLFLQFEETGSDDEANTASELSSMCIKICMYMYMVPVTYRYQHWSTSVTTYSQVQCVYNATSAVLRSTRYTYTFNSVL